MKLIATLCVTATVLIATAAHAGTVNVALFKPTTASTQSFGGDASDGNDGSIGVNNNWVHSDTAAGGTWTVDLLGTIELDSVTMHARSGFVQRVQGSTITFKDHTGATVATETVNITSGLSQNIALDGGTLVRSIEISGPSPSDFFNWHEFEVFANNRLLGADAEGSTQLGGNVPERATNGSIAGGNTDISHTDFGDLNPTWTGNMDELIRVDSVVLFNRTSCCQGRLENITVQLLGPDKATVLATSAVLNPNHGDGDPRILAVDMHEAFGGPVSGAQYVRVLKDAGSSDEEFLSLSEVQAFGTAYNGPQSVTLQSATALGSQANNGGLSVNHAIDGVITSGSASGWGNGIGSPEQYTDNVAAFETASDLDGYSEAILHFTMNFNSFTDHGIGHFRLLATTADRSEFADGLINNGDVDFTGGDVGSWFVLDDLIGFATASGLELLGGVLQGDGSFLIDETANPSTDQYDIWLRTTVTGITGFRLELIDGPDGPGLASNNNSVLTEFSVEILTIPTPAALPAGLLMIGAIAARRRRMK